ncbi:MAG: AMP-binding protein [Myxococcota bacterium]|nr:AMP-binding protein [Myxococcota bacterium]
MQEADAKTVRIEDALWRSAETSAPRPAIATRDRTLTHRELARAASALAREIRDAGVAPGDRVAVFLDKSIESVVAIYGAWIAGAVVVPIHEALKRLQIEHILSDSGARLLITERRRLQRAQALDLAVPRLELDRARVAGRDDAGAAHEHPQPTGPDELAAILYTSGSTGRPKGIALSHANLIAGARIVSRYLGITADERILSVLPFSFDYGLNQLLTVIDRGATLYLQRSHAPADICRALEAHEITGLAGVPPLWAQLVQRGSPLPTLSLPRLRYITNSGGVFPQPLLARYRRMLPATDIVLMYGLTEAFRSTYLPPAEIDLRPGSMGRAIPETDVLVVDDDGRRCPPGVIGELVHAGPTVALGYWQDEAASRDRFRPHPLEPASGARVVYSGDLVRQDEDGFFYFVSRRDQMLKCFGFRVSPEDVEEQILASGLVHEVAITGRPDEVAGTALVAHVVPSDPERFDAAALVDFCRAQMPSYMVPAEVVVRVGLPRTSSGKLDRKSVGVAA